MKIFHSTKTGGVVVKLSELFGGSIAKILDQSVIVGDMKQTASTLAELTGLSSKTIRKVANKLVKLGLMESFREGKTKYYRFKTQKIRYLIKFIEEV